MKKRNVNAKEVVLPHSKAKLIFYKDYLKIYISILRSSDFSTSVNIFDVFCGTGIYEDGEIGSPILAYEAIKESYSYIKNKDTLRLVKMPWKWNDLGGRADSFSEDSVIWHCKGIHFDKEPFKTEYNFYLKEIGEC